MKQIRIYQLPVKHNAKFMRLSFVKEHKIMPKLEDYKLVWEGKVKEEADYAEECKEFDFDFLDIVYTKFNGMIKGDGMPADFKGHSLSTSDVVEVDGKYYYCDSYGWVEVTELFPKPTLKKGEKYECIKDYVMEDGSIAYKAGKTYEMLSDIHLGIDEGGSELHKMSDERDFYLHFNKTSNETEEAKIIDLEENGTRCAGETPAIKVELAEARRRKQYTEFKAKNPNALLLFRCGDFYETYFDDAITVSKVLGITLTYNHHFDTMTGHEMAGFPHHALDVYLPKLIRAGHKCAIIEDV